MAAPRRHAPSLADTSDTPPVGGPETAVLCLHAAPELHELHASIISSPRRHLINKKFTLFYNLSNENLGEARDNLCHGHGYLLTEALLNYLARRRFQKWALTVVWARRLEEMCHSPSVPPASGGRDGDMPRIVRTAPA